jgi:hypothetical protein
MSTKAHLVELARQHKALEHEITEGAARVPRRHLALGDAASQIHHSSAAPLKLPNNPHNKLASQPQQGSSPVPFDDAVFLDVHTPRAEIAAALSTLRH